MSLEPKMVADRLSRLLSKAIQQSGDLEQQVAVLRRRGFQVSIDVRKAESHEGARSEVVQAGTARQKSEPVFCLEGSDVAFLESLGIDATRSARRRRGQ